MIEQTDNNTRGDAPDDDKDKDGNVPETMEKTTGNDESINEPAVSKEDNALEESGKGNAADREVPLNARDEWSDFFKTAIIAIILAMIIRTFLYEPFNIPSGSMKPTLEIGDYLFVSKPAYGFSRHSFPFAMAPIEEGRRIWTGGRMPERGDVVVFKLPTNNRTDFIKRIIGLPGDTVEVREGRLYINRKLVPRDPVGLKKIEEYGAQTTIMEYIETLPNGVAHPIYEEADNMPLDNTDEFTVPEGHYFMMGDNRDNSQDSRVMDHVGFVPYDHIVGKADFIFFSTNGTASLGEIWKWPKTIRYERLFMDIKPHHLPPEEYEALEQKHTTLYQPIR